MILIDRGKLSVDTVVETILPEFAELMVLEGFDEKRPLQMATQAPSVPTRSEIGFVGEAIATANAIVVGLALIAETLGAIFVPRAWEEWTDGVLGLWVIVSPWALGFTALSGARLTGWSRAS